MLGVKKRQLKRDSISVAEFELLIKYVFNNISTLKQTQLILVFNLLFYYGLRVDEIRQLTVKDLIEFIETKKLLIYIKKQNINKFLYYYTDFLNFNITDLTSLNLTYLFQNQKTNLPYSRPYFNKLINKTLKNFIQHENLRKNIKSHSFRIGFITTLIKKNINLEKVKQLMSHKNIQTTLKYSRFELDESETKNLLLTFIKKE